MAPTIPSSLYTLHVWVINKLITSAGQENLAKDDFSCSVEANRFHSSRHSSSTREKSVRKKWIPSIAKFYFSEKENVELNIWVLPPRISIRYTRALLFIFQFQLKRMNDICQKKRRWRKTKYINKMEWQDWNWNSECSARATVCLCQTLAHTSAFTTGISFMFIVHCPMSTQSAVRNGFSFFDFVLCWTASVDRWKCITKLKSQDTWPAYKCV